jgi:hypothetical protein
MRSLAPAPTVHRQPRRRPEIDPRIEYVIGHRYPHAEVGFNAIQAKTDEFGSRLCMRHGIVMADQAESQFIQGRWIPGSLSVHFSNYICSMCSPSEAQPLVLTFGALLAECENLIDD